MKRLNIQKSILLLDKPSGPTSFDVVEGVSKILKVKRAGHSGTLDPRVTGLMLIALGESRKAMPVFMCLNKEYIGRMYVHGNVNKKKLRNVFKRFVGEIEQMPPVKSRVKRVIRKRRIYELEITNIEGRYISFRVLCEHGTYIRKLCHQIGEELGTGAHMTQLRRTKIDGFSVDEAISMDDLKMGERKRGFVSLEKALERVNFKKVVVCNKFIEKIRNGSPLRESWRKCIDSNIRENERIGIYDERGNIIALGVANDGQIKTDRVFNI